ncbi:unnamed protein product [Strongylus vulgaris]|uniref:Uncharacterized protein n=1 Tax=Strongylus vulgaris TaxID=40348 RepID=A0A3P7L0R6_STRVU|nr:unnamed protein product [Strongylus vulgaris]
MSSAKEWFKRNFHLPLQAAVNSFIDTVSPLEVLRNCSRPMSSREMSPGLGQRAVTERHLSRRSQSFPIVDELGRKVGGTLGKPR